MELVTTVEQVRDAVAQAKSRNRPVGLVPTMGALHEGHLSLIRAARDQTGFVVVSVFVNPTQFGPGEDLDHYPHTLVKDTERCQAEGVDLVFTPDNDTMYCPDHATYVHVTGLEDKLCGASRPGHFRGVCTVVTKLLHIVGPDRAYFGQKDAQQARLITKMVEDLNIPVEIVVCPTVREPDGLAMSSRNAYLDPAQRTQALVLHEALQSARREIAAGERSAERLCTLMRRHIGRADDAHIDYVAVVDPDSLDDLQRIERRALIALAVQVGPARLIDNLIVEVERQD